MSFHWMPAAHDEYPGFDWILKQRKEEVVPPEERLIELNGSTTYLVKLGRDRVLMGVYPTPSTTSAHSIFDKRAIEQKLKYVMVNASGAPKNSSGVKHRKRLEFKKKHIVFQDSGGFQLYSGVEKFLDPEEVGDTHQRYADEGVGLDIPLGVSTDPSIVVPAARVQYWNNQLMRNSFKGPIFVTSHGAYAESRIRYLKELLALYKGEIEFLCIAALRPILGHFTPTLQQIAAHLSYVLHRVPAKRVHLLGVSTFETHVLAAAASQIYGRVITADSSRHILAGAGGSCLTPFLRDAGQRSRKQGAQLSSHFHIASGCSCTICSEIKYDHLQHLSRFLQTHSFNSLVLSQENSREVAQHYLNEISVPYLPEMLKSIHILQQPKAKSEETLLKFASARRHSYGLFAGANLSQLPKTLRGTLERYAKFHKKSLG